LRVERNLAVSLNNARVKCVSKPTTRDAKRAATAQRILEAAQHEFGEHGLEATTVRDIAKRAGVDPSLVNQHYGSKHDLFALAARLEPGTPTADVAQHISDVLEIRIGAPTPETRALMRSMLTAPEATASMQAFLDERVTNLARAIQGDDAELRAALTVSSILGLTIARHFLKLDALTNVPDEQLAGAARQWLTTRLNDDTPSYPESLPERGVRESA
jgi:AcrR family transcriptional regulator